MVRAQSQSVVRGEHPMAFMLPSVSLSEVSSEGNVVIMTSHHDTTVMSRVIFIVMILCQAGSETDSMSCYSDLEPVSPYSSLATMTGSSGIYSQSLALLSPHSSPR